jgi:hypothetical protein
MRCSIVDASVFAWQSLTEYLDFNEQETRFIWIELVNRVDRSITYIDFFRFRQTFLDAAFLSVRLWCPISIRLF